jgi:IPT/TIG domain
MRRTAILTVTILTISGLWSGSPASAATPVVDSFDPTSGPPGTDVTIFGSGFTGTTEVTFGGTSTGFVIDSDLQISASVPIGATTGPIEVTNPDGTGTSATDFTVTPSPTPPNITDISPRRGPIGTQVSVSGTNLDDVHDVRLGGREVNFTVLSPTLVRFKVDRGSRSGRVKVVSPDGSDTSGVIFRIRKDKHGSVIAFKLEKHLVATGSVRAADREATCKRGRKVVVERRIGGSWRVVKSDRTGRLGKYRVALPDNEGTYRATVRKKSTLRDVCKSRTSDTRRHRHKSDGGGGDGDGGGGGCHPSYPDHCIPPPPPDLDCFTPAVPWTNFRVVGSDPHGFDGNDDGVGCET